MLDIANAHRIITQVRQATAKARRFCSPTDAVQIICLQTLHYLTLTIIVPPLLGMFTTPALLTYSGGPRTVAHIMDWREMAARPAVNTSPSTWRKLRGAWAGGRKVGESQKEGSAAGSDSAVGGQEPEAVWDYGVDDRRGWLLGAAWIMAAGVE